ncbi:MAG: anti-sigma factor antagonist [Clostridia bacterium]|nr:anti-sigma factor antagonist [Clostridia bacterium]
MKHTVQMETEQGRKALVISLCGELDHHSAGKLREEIDAELEKHGFGFCILDMSGVSFMDSSGLGVILGRYRLVTEHGGTLAVRNPNKTVDRILKMSGIYSIVEVKK